MTNDPSQGPLPRQVAECRPDRQRALIFAPLSIQDRIRRRTFLSLAEAPVDEAETSAKAGALNRGKMQ